MWLCREDCEYAFNAAGRLGGYFNTILSSAIFAYSPFCAWRKYAARGSPSTSTAISSRRGSGCMTMALAFIKRKESELIT